MAQLVKNLPAMREMAFSTGGLGSISESERSPGEGNGNPLQDSFLRSLVGCSPWDRKSPIWLKFFPLQTQDVIFPLHMSPDCRSSWARLGLRTGGGLDKCLESRAQVINSLPFPLPPPVSSSLPSNSSVARVAKRECYAFHLPVSQKARKLFLHFQSTGYLQQPPPWQDASNRRD